MTRHVLVALLLVSATFAVGYAARAALFPPPASAPPPPSAAKVEGASLLTVSHLQGRVELREAKGGDWLPLARDAHVSERDRVRTEDGASAVLSAGDGLQLEVSAHSQVELVTMQRDRADVVVERGRLSAHVENAALSVGVQGSDAQLQTNQAAFSVLRDDHGQVAVAVSDGALALSAQHQQVRVAAGEQSIVAPERAPAPPTRIPASLFLKVARLGPKRLNRRSTELGGETTPGAAVYVNGVAVKTDATGHFTARVELREGENALQVSSHDVLGRSQRQDLAPVYVDTEPPALQGKTVW